MILAAIISFLIGSAFGFLIAALMAANEKDEDAKHVVRPSNCGNCKWYLWYDSVCSNPNGHISECTGPGNRCDAWEEQ